MIESSALGERIGRLSERQRLCSLFAFALVLRLIYLHEIQSSPFFGVLLGDAATYDAWALRIQDGWLGTEVFFQAPLYPYFLAVIDALFGHDLVLIRVLQMALGSAACVLLAEAGRDFFSRDIGFVSGIVLAVYGPALFFDGLVQKSCLDVFLTTLLLFVLGRLERARRSSAEETRSAPRLRLLTGCVLGCLALTRENALIWVPCLLWWIASDLPRAHLLHGARKRLLPFGLGLSLVLVPVLARNAWVGGAFFITTSQLGQNLYIGNNAQADGTYQSLRFGHGGAELERRDAIELAQAAEGRELSAAQVSHYWSERAWSFVKAEPGKWGALLSKKWLLVWNARELSDSDEPLVYADASTLFRMLSIVFCFGTLCPLAFAGAVIVLRRPERFLLLHVLALALAASTALFFVFARYRYPLVPLLIPLAVVAVFEAMALFRARTLRPLAVLALLVACGTIVTHLNLVPNETPRATAYYDLGVSLERLQRPSEAKTSYLEALSNRPDFVEAHINVGALLAQEGSLDEAAAHELAALRLRPEDALAHADLGNVLFEQGQLLRAAQHYLKAQQLDPGQPQAREGLAAVRERLREQDPSAPHD